MYGRTLTLRNTQMYGRTLTLRNTQMYGRTLTLRNTQMYGRTLTLRNTQMYGRTLTLRNTQMYGRTLTLRDTHMYGRTLTLSDVWENSHIEKHSDVCRAAINSDFVRVFGLFGHHKPTRTDFYKLGIFLVIAHAHLHAPPRPASERERRWSPTTIILDQQSTKWTSAIP